MENVEREKNWGPPNLTYEGYQNWQGHLIFVHTKGGPRYSVYNASVSENQEVILKGMWCSS
jgi:hypothetical protein